MTAPSPRRGFDWEAAATKLAGSLDEYHALVVAGVDPVATGRVAVAIGRVQGLKRHVAVGDLFAESPPIQELVTTDDPHGLVDSFLYGVSLSKIASPVPESGQLFVMPSGTEPPDYDEILPNPRWHRLAAGFREMGALLVLAVPASAPHIEDLVSATDGAIIVGDSAPSKVRVIHVISAVREPTGQPVAPRQPEAAARSTRRMPRRRVAAIAGVLLTLALAGGALWLAMRPLAGRGRGRTGPSPDTTAGIGAVVPAVRPESSQASADSVAAAVAAASVPHVTNPQDSAQAAAFAVELMAANTQAGAILKLQQDGKTLPAATFAPVLDSQGARWFKVLGGAFPERAGADSLLVDLRRRKVLDAGSGSVVRLPFAFLIDSAVRATAVPGLVANYADRGQPVYALRQADGSAWLLVGAFESIDQSGLYAESLRASGIVPVLVYRKGRTF